MKVASFNIQKFGEKKVSDGQILSTLIKIVSRYGIILILEVVDAKGEAMRTFLQELNKANKMHPYKMVTSSRLGRKSYKEQFMFLYREDLVTLMDTFQYEDNQKGDEDAFAREPYILRFTCLDTVLKDLVLIPVHTKPEDSEKELDELYDVFLTVKEKWKTDDIMILGDFNADGAYVSKKKMKKIRIRSDANFHWLIGDDVDTTASTGNDHSYDRIVVYGDDMLEATVPNSAQPFDFHQAYGLTEDMALSISDHYPVEVTLKVAETKKRRKSPSLNPKPAERIRVRKRRESPSQNPKPAEKVRVRKRRKSPSLIPKPAEQVRVRKRRKSPSLNPKPVKQVRVRKRRKSPSLNPKPVEQVRVRKRRKSPSLNPKPLKQVRVRKRRKSPSLNPKPVKQVRVRKRRKSPSLNPKPEERVRVRKRNAKQQCSCLA